MSNLNNHFQIISISGDDSTIFLQGQLTNDIVKLQEYDTQYSAYLNIKGRMVANFIIFRHKKDMYYLLTTTSIIQYLTQKLKMYVLRSKVTIQILDTDIFFIENNDSINKYQQITLPGTNKAFVLNNNNEQHVYSLIETKLFLINNKINFIYDSTKEKLLPQNINMDNAISYTKGCYLGQEIMSRLYYKGEVKQLLHIVTSTEELTIGDTVTNSDGNKVGIVTDTVYYDNNYLSLASIKNNAIDSTLSCNYKITLNII